MQMQLQPPDIRRWRRGNTNIDYVTTIDSGRPGPHVMVNAISHGNEISGALVVDRLLDLKLSLSVGKLTLSFANVEAFHRFNSQDPHANRYVDEDFNRVWNPEYLDSDKQSVELKRAREMRPLIDQIDILLELHSMHDVHKPMLLSGPLAKSVEFCEKMASPCPTIRFLITPPKGRQLRDYGAFADPASPKCAVLLESGWHWAASSEVCAWDTAWRFLGVTGIFPISVVDGFLDKSAAPNRQLIEVVDQVIATSPCFRIADNIHGLDVLPRGALIARDAGEEIRAPFDGCVLIMPTNHHVLPGLPGVRLGRIVAEGSA